VRCQDSKTNMIRSLQLKAESYTDKQNKWREDFSPRGVRQTVEASLVRLGLDSIPLLHLHGPEIVNLTDDLLDTPGRLKEEGKVRHLSVNSFDEKVIQHVATIPLFEAVMVDYSILRPERGPMIKRLASQGVGVMAGMALGAGPYRNRFQVRRIQDLWYFARAWKNHRADIKRERHSALSIRKRDGQAANSQFHGYCEIQI
jgi:aryl-alcohol dehydrogenase-like predicted oxidoreductase